MDDLRVRRWHDGGAHSCLSIIFNRPIEGDYDRKCLDRAMSAFVHALVPQEPPGAQVKPAAHQPPSESVPAVQEQQLLAGGWLPIVLCPTDGEWRLCKLLDGSEVVASFYGQDLGPFVRRWRVREFGYDNPARPTGEIFGWVERIAPAYGTAVIKDLPEGVCPIYFRPNDTVYGHPALRTQGGE